MAIHILSQYTCQIFYPGEISRRGTVAKMSTPSLFNFYNLSFKRDGIFQQHYRTNKTCSGLVSQFCDVVLVRRTFSWENPRGRDFGMGREWGGDGNGEISLRAPWDQGGRDPITARRVPSK